MTATPLSPGLSRGDKAIHFATGFFGVLLINGLLFGAVAAAATWLSSQPSIQLNEIGAVLFLAGSAVAVLGNIVALVLLAIRRPWIAVGAASAIGVAVVLAAIGVLVFGLAVLGFVGP